MLQAAESDSHICSHTSQDRQVTAVVLTRSGQHLHVCVHVCSSPVHFKAGGVVVTCLHIYRVLTHHTHVHMHTHTTHACKYTHVHTSSCTLYVSLSFSIFLLVRRWLHEEIHNKSSKCNGLGNQTDTHTHAQTYTYGKHPTQKIEVQIYLLFHLCVPFHLLLFSPFSLPLSFLALILSTLLPADRLQLPLIQAPCLSYLQWIITQSPQTNNMAHTHTAVVGVGVNNWYQGFT